MLFDLSSFRASLLRRVRRYRKEIAVLRDYGPRLLLPVQAGPMSLF